jgi:hypothetical protein
MFDNPKGKSHAKRKAQANSHSSTDPRQLAQPGRNHHVERERIESRLLGEGRQSCGPLLEWLATNRPTHHDYLIALNCERPFVRASPAAEERVIAHPITSDLNRDLPHFRLEVLKFTIRRLMFRFL